MAPPGGELCDKQKRTAYRHSGIDFDALKASCVNLIDTALEAKPKDMTIATHVCRSNFRSTWFSSGGYGPVAPYLFQLNYDGFFLEYDTDRAGGFTLTETTEHHHTVVLGLITSKDGKLEGENAVIERIHEVEQHLPLEQLHLPTQCGFSSTEEGHVLTEEDRWNKLALVRRIAEKV